MGKRCSRSVAATRLDYFSKADLVQRLAAEVSKDLQLCIYFPRREPSSTPRSSKHLSSREFERHCQSKYRAHPTAFPVGCKIGHRRRTPKEVFSNDIERGRRSRPWLAPIEFTHCVYQRP